MKLESEPMTNGSFGGSTKIFSKILVMGFKPRHFDPA